MAVASLPQLCLERIFKYLSNDLNSQYSCILINRYWCSSLIAKLWANPFEFLKAKNGIKIHPNLHLINTYLICLPEDTQTFVGIQEISKPPLFNYASFLRYISIQNIGNSVMIWAKHKNIKETPKFKTFLFNKENNEVPIEAVGSIIKVLVEYLFTSSTYIKGVEGIDQYRGRYLNVYLNVYELPNAETKLSQIQFYKYGADGLVTYASRISKDIRQLEIRLKEDITPLKDISKLIQSQRNLQQIFIQYDPTFYTQNEIIDLWDNLMIHTENLVDIIFSRINFNIRFPLECLSKFHNLRRLSFFECKIINVYPLDFYFEEYDDDQANNNSPLIKEIQSFQKLESLIIRKSDIKINKIEILLRQAATSLHSLELLDLDYLTDLEYFTHFFSNITRLTVGINMRWKIVVSIVKSAKLLREFNICEGRSHDLITVFGKSIKPMSADNFLCEVGRVMGEQVHVFRFSSDWYFSPNSLNTFLRRCKVSQLKILDFRKCKFFSNEHLDHVIEFCGGTLSYFYCEEHHSFTQADLLRAKQAIGNVTIENFSIKNEQSSRNI